MPFVGVSADFATPWRSLISLFSFVTLRGWPHIFWAIRDTSGSPIALLFLVLIPMFTTLTVVNLFCAIFIVSLKEGEDHQRKRELLTMYPGDIHQVSEIELMVWESRNQRELMLSKVQDKSAINLSEAIGAEEDVEVVPRDRCVPNCLGCSTLRYVFARDDSTFSKLLMCIVILNIFILAIDSADANDTVQEAIYVCNLIFLGVYATEVIIKVAVLGPYLYFFSVFNLMDFFLTLMGYFSVLYSLPKLFVNFRLFRLLRLIRLYRLVALIDVEKARKSRDVSITPSKFFFMFGDFGPPLTNVTVLLLLSMYIYAVLGMQLFGAYNFSEVNTVGMSGALNSTALNQLRTTGDIIILTDLQKMWYVLLCCSCACQSHRYYS